MPRPSLPRSKSHQGQVSQVLSQDKAEIKPRLKVKEVKAQIKHKNVTSNLQKLSDSRSYLFKPWSTILKGKSRGSFRDCSYFIYKWIKLQISQEIPIKRNLFVHSLEKISDTFIQYMYSQATHIFNTLLILKWMLPCIKSI